MARWSGNERRASDTARASARATDLTRAITAAREHGKELRHGARRSAVACALLLSALAGCDAEPAQRVWPEGTVLAVDDVPITRAELAADVAAVQLVEPRWSEPQLRRLALNEVALIRALLRAEAGEEARAAALKSLDERFERVASGAQFGPASAGGALGEESSGTWKALGLSVWGAGFELAPGAWSERIEAPGRFVRVRLLERRDGAMPSQTELRLDVLEAPYSTLRGWPGDGDALMSRHRLTIVDPAWHAIVPERTKHMMGANRP